MKTAMHILCSILTITTIGMTFTTGIESKANQLWKEQMSRMDKIISEYKLPESENQKNSRMIGLPFFDINFVDNFKDETTVHSLRPQDIDIVGAMGDSLTAANGAEGQTVAEIGIEYRSICFSAGGNGTLEESITVPNILKKFNSRLDGYSYLNGPRVNQYPYGFNVAVPGARARDMYGQVVRLIDLLKTDDRSNYEDDWKLVTLFIGGNDLCAIGRDPDGASAETYVAEIKRALDLLHANVPRLFISIVDILEIYLLPQVGTGYGSTPQCRAMQSSFCNYVVVDAINDETEQERLKAINKQYQIQLQELINSGIYDTRDDFTVVIQPFLRDTVLPYTDDGEVDATYFAPDCFHFSDIGHSMSAINLWNNMLEPVGSKSTVWSITDLKVPTEEHPYLFTSKNSLPPTPAPPPDEEVTEEVPVWLICVIAVLFVVVLGQFVVLFSMRRSFKNNKHVLA
ncbi:phospholipase B1, membrane-associated-like [Styela clava]